MQFGTRLGIVIVQRDEGDLLLNNVVYHLNIGVHHVLVIDNGSTDSRTLEVLESLSRKPKVTVRFDGSDGFDQEQLANEGIQYLKSHCGQFDWIMSLDADEFFAPQPDLSSFLIGLNSSGHVYVSIRMTNNIPRLKDDTFKIVPAYLASQEFYFPKPERPWQEERHLAKALCRDHAGIRVAVGNHFFYHATLCNQYPFAPYTPPMVDTSAALLLHFEMRDGATALLAKWSTLGRRHRVPGSDPQADWWEKRDRMLELASIYNQRVEDLYNYIATNPTTLWGNHIPSDSIINISILKEVLG